jgi:FecR protein
MQTRTCQREKGYSLQPTKVSFLLVGLLILLGSTAAQARAQDSVRVKILTMTSCNETDDRISPAAGVTVRFNSASVHTDSTGYTTTYLRPGIYEVSASLAGATFAYVDRRGDGVRFRPDSRGIASVPLSSSDETLEIRLLSCGTGVAVGGVVVPGAVVVAPGAGGITISSGTGGVAVAVTTVKRARLTAINNSVEVQLANGAWVRAYEGQELAQGDRVRTGYLSTVSLRFWDGHQAQLRQRSQLTLRASGGALNYGEMRVTIGPPGTGPSNFDVTTTTCTVNVRGTIFTVIHDETPQATTVWVEEGVVLVTPVTPTLQSVTLRSGQEARVTTGYISPVVTRGAVVAVDLPLLAGIWITSTGDRIQLTQDGNRITGTYNGVLGAGTIAGTLEGRTFKGTVTIGQGSRTTSGAVTLTLTPDGRLDGTVSSVIYNGPWILSRGGGRLQ